MELIRRDYYANGGWETFLSYEDVEQDILYYIFSSSLLPIVNVIEYYVLIKCVVKVPLLDKNILIGLLRLRKCSEETFRSELKGGCSIVRELHVYPYY